MIPVISLIVLVGVIAPSVITKKNAGVLTIIAAFIFASIAQAYGVEINAAKIVTSGWPMSVFLSSSLPPFSSALPTLTAPPRPSARILPTSPGATPSCYRSSSSCWAR